MKDITIKEVRLSNESQNATLNSNPNPNPNPSKQYRLAAYTLLPLTLGSMAEASSFSPPEQCTSTMYA